MKKKLYLLTYLLLSIYLGTNAQNVERTFRPAFFSTPNFIVPFKENKILIGGKGINNSLQGEVPFLLMVDTLGNILWEHDVASDFPNNERIFVKDIFVENESILVEVYTAPFCDSGGGPSDLLKLDSTGQIDIIYLNSNFPKVKYANLYASIDLFNFYILDSNFQVLHSESLLMQLNNYPNVTDLEYVDPFFLASTKSNSLPCGLVKIDTPSIFFNYYTVTTECLDFGDIHAIEISDNENIFLQNENRILSINENFEVTNELTFADSVVITNFKINKNRLIVFCDSLSSNSIRIYTEDFDLLHQINMEEELKLFPKHAFIQNNKLYVVGEEHSKHRVENNFSFFEEDSHSSIFFRSYPLDNSYEFPIHDIGISSIFMDEAPISLPPNCRYDEQVECGPTMKLDYKNVYVTLTNYGTHILDNCTVNTRLEPCRNCSFFCSKTYIKSVSYKDLNLMPGESIEVFFGDIEAHDQQVNPTHHLCMWTANPNNLIDKNIENDLFCIDSEVTKGIVKDQTVIDFCLFPNPSDSGKVNLQVASDNEEREVFIHDAIGKLISSYHMDANTEKLKMDLSNFSKGVYIISVKIYGITTAKKLVLH